MSTEVWVSFVGASFVICLIPGPTILLVMAQALNHGRQSVFPLVLGTGAGNVIAMVLSFVGLGAILATSAALYEVIKWLGAGYLFYLGINYWRSPIELVSGSEHSMMTRVVLRDAFIVTAFNPKSIIFFVMLSPLFIDDTQPLFLQMLIMMISFMVVSVMTVVMYGYCCGYIHNKLQSVSVRKLFNWTGGGLLIAAGALTVIMQT